MAADMSSSFAAQGQDQIQTQGQIAVTQEPSVKLTRGHSCVLCQQRKVRCDKNKPCANCLKAGVECTVVAPQPPRRRKKKPQERELIDRLRKYETLLSQHGVDFEPIGQTFKSSDPTSLDDLDEIEHGSESTKQISSSLDPAGSFSSLREHKIVFFPRLSISSSTVYI